MASHIDEYVFMKEPGKLGLRVIYQGNPYRVDRLLDYDELFSWQQDNEFIISGYRPASLSFRKSIASLKYINNETVNIYSHLFGAIFFTIFPLLVFRNIYFRDTTTTMGDLVVFSTFFFGVVTCFFLSATFHTFNNHSSEVHRQGNQLDYLGIVILMWGSTIPSVYYGFYCDPKLQNFYWMVVTLIAAACIYATLHPSFCSPSLRPWRAMMYAGLGLSAILFIIHGLATHGWIIQKNRMSLKWMALMGCLNMTGAVIYVCRVPERWFPRKYDIYGNSHQILHFMVILAALVHMFGLLRAFDHVHMEPEICNSI